MHVMQCVNVRRNEELRGELQTERAMQCASVETERGELQTHARDAMCECETE